MTTQLVQYVPLPVGDAGAILTLQAMTTLVRRPTKARALVFDLMPDYGNRDEQIEAIRDFLESRFQFVYDPAPMDRVANPDFLMQELVSKGIVRGDCDDAAVLAAFFADTFAIPWKFRAVGFHPNAPLSHVYVLLRGSQGFTTVDVTRNRSQVVPAARRVLDYP